MPDVTITLRDTPTGGVAVHTDFKPALGSSCSPAQSTALDIVNRIHREWPGEPAPNSAQSAATAQPAQPADTLISRVRKVIKDHLLIELAPEQDGDHLVEKHGADSLDLIEISLELEHEFHIEIAPEETDNITTVAQFAELVQTKLQAVPA